MAKRLSPGPMSCLPQPCCPAALTRRGLSSTSLLSGKRNPRYGARDQTPVSSSVLVLDHSLPRHKDWERAKLAKLAYSSLYCGWITIAKIPKPNARTAVPGVLTLLTTWHDTYTLNGWLGCNIARRSCHFWVYWCICIIPLSSLLCSPLHIRSRCRIVALGHVPS